MKWVVPTAMALIVAAATTAAAADCRCRGSDGTLFEQGELACIRTAKGPRLARCGMVLNNSSWTVVRDSCPSAEATPAPPPAASAYVEAAVLLPGARLHRDVP